MLAGDFPAQKAGRMLLAQITDVHIGFDTGNPDEFNRQRLDAVLARLADGPNPPDVLLATGDLTDKGDDESYARLAAAFAATPWPVYPCVGNHDVRDAFVRHFPGFADEHGFIQYERDAGAMRLIVIDTLEEGRHGGAFCDTRVAWLRVRLAERRDVPTYIVMHHPPVDCGIEWMTTDPTEPWVAAFRSAIAGAGQLRGLICGHLHRSLTLQWQGLTVAICSSTAPQVSLDLRPIDVDAPDGRPMIVAEDPAYALHHWNGETLVSYFDRAAPGDVLARYDGRMQGLVRELIGERPE
jgi:3',5'-cyclic-AMP phosphodiesterase